MLMVFISLLICSNLNSKNNLTNSYYICGSEVKTLESVLINPIPAPKSDINDLSRAFGYIEGQQISLNMIKLEFPDLVNEVKSCEIEFSISFGKAKERITEELKKTLGVNYQEYNTQITNELKTITENQEYNKEIALNFIKEVKSRAKGKIESPVIETLLTYQFLDNPSKEFTNGFTKIYTTDRHPKAKGLMINAKLPRSWNQMEGDRPNIVQKFISENGNGNEMVLFMVKDLGLPNDYKITQAELDEFFIESQLRQLMPDGSQYISAKRITLDSQTGGQIIFKTTQERLDFTITMQAVHYITIYKGKMVFLQCMVYAEQNENLTERFNLFFPLFRQIANSIVLVNQY